MENNPETPDLFAELRYQFSRSGGKGGQHVNKTETRVELFFDVGYSEILTDEQKALLLKNLATRLTKENVLHLSCEEKRSQLANKKLVTERFYELIAKGLVKPKKRKKKSISKAAKEKRLKAKKVTSEKKQRRNKGPFKE